MRHAPMVLPSHTRCNFSVNGFGCEYSRPDTEKAAAGSFTLPAVFFNKFKSR